MELYTLGVHPWGEVTGSAIGKARTLNECLRLARDLDLWSKGEVYVMRGGLFGWPRRGNPRWRFGNPWRMAEQLAKRVSP